MYEVRKVAAANNGPLRMNVRLQYHIILSITFSGLSVSGSVFIGSCIVLPVCCKRDWPMRELRFCFFAQKLADLRLDQYFRNPWRRNLRNKIPFQFFANFFFGESADYSHFRGAGPDSPPPPPCPPVPPPTAAPACPQSSRPSGSAAGTTRCQWDPRGVTSPRPGCTRSAKPGKSKRKRKTTMRWV